MDNLAGFGTGQWGNVKIAETMYSGRVLEVVVPHGGSAMQRQVIDRIVEYGSRCGVCVDVIRMP